MEFRRPPAIGWGHRAFLATGDFNLDGVPDLVTANASTPDGAVSILLGSANGTFRPAVDNVVAYQAMVVAVADFNGDGKPDLAVGEWAGLDILLGNGDGSFQSPVTFGRSSLSFSGLTAADVNRDGVPDLIGVESPYVNGEAVVVLMGNGDGTFQPAVRTPLVPAETLLDAIGDFNGDGIPDLVMADGNDATQMLVYLGNADGTIQTPLSFAPPATFLSGLAVGDFNGDGKQDVAVVYGEVAWYAGNGDGTFQTPVISAVSGSGYATAGDFNGDGRLDIASRNYGTNTVTLTFGNGNGTFQSGVMFSADGYPGNIVLADFNRDGKPDFAVLNQSTNSVNVFLGGQVTGLNVTSSHSGSFIIGQTGATYQILVSNLQYVGGSGTVTVTDTLPSGFTATAMSGAGWTCAIETLTCTRSDALSADSSYPPITLTVSISGSLSPSTFTNHATVVSSAGTSSAVDPTALLSQPVTSLVVTPATSLLGQTVTFTATVTAGATGIVEFLDGMNVLGVSAVTAGQAHITTSLLPSGLRQLRTRYGGDATHANAISQATPFAVSTVAGGNFTTVNYLGGNTLAAIATGDFNNDGKMDMVTANTGGNSVSVFLGNGDGTFRPRVDLSVGSEPAGVAVGDLNGDGKADLAVSNQGNGTVSILLGNGDGTFQPPVNYAAGSSPAGITFGDFNGDGKEDVAVGDAVLLGTAMGHYSESCLCLGAARQPSFSSRISTETTKLILSSRQTISTHPTVEPVSCWETATGRSHPSHFQGAVLTVSPSET